MKKLPFLILALMTCAAFAVDNGGVSEGKQVWDGRKVFLWDNPVATLATGNITLDENSKNVQQIDANGSGRNVTLPPIASSQAYKIRIINTSSTAVNLTVKNVAASTIGTIHQSEAGDFYCDGATWTGFVYTAAASGFLTADGATTAATSQTQTFTNGVTLDTVIGATAAPLTVTAKVGATDTIGNAINVAGGAGNGATNGGLASLIGGASGAGATGTGGLAKLVGGAATSTAGAGGASQVTGGLGTTTGAGGAATITGGVGGSSGSGGAASLKGGASAGAGGTAGAVAIDAGAATGGTGAGVTIGTTNALSVTLGKTVWTPATVVDVAGAGGTITVPTLTSSQRVTATGSAGTGTILAVGTIDGQILTIINVSANTITFATTATSHVADGVTTVIGALASKTFIWDNTTLKWYCM